MTKLIIFCFIFLLSFFCLVDYVKSADFEHSLPSLSQSEKVLTPDDYKKIYDSLPILDIFYINNEDPEETYEYYDAITYSPYPLMRVNVAVNCKNIRLLPGEYLIKPASHNAYDFIMFKQNGTFSGLVPVYEKIFVGEDIVKEKEIKRPLTKRQKRWQRVKTVFKIPFKKILRPPEHNKFAIESKYSPAKEYMIIDFYYIDTLYKMLFKIEKPER